jgi:peroxiredoxin
LGVSQDNVAASRDFARDFGITFPVLIDAPGYPASNAYGLTTVPTFFLINQDATVQVASVGFGKAEIESIANTLADRRNIRRAPVFRSDESIPVHKPG